MSEHKLVYKSRSSRRIHCNLLNLVYDSFWSGFLWINIQNNISNHILCFVILEWVDAGVGQGIQVGLKSVLELLVISVSQMPIKELNKTGLALRGFRCLRQYIAIFRYSVNIEPLKKIKLQYRCGIFIANAFIINFIRSDRKRCNNKHYVHNSWMGYRVTNWVGCFRQN